MNTARDRSMTSCGFEMGNPAGPSDRQRLRTVFKWVTTSTTARFWGIFGSVTLCVTNRRSEMKAAAKLIVLLRGNAPKRGASPREEESALREQL